MRGDLEFWRDLATADDVVHSVDEILDDETFTDAEKSGYLTGYLQGLCFILAKLRDTKTAMIMDPWDGQTPALLAVMDEVDLRYAQAELFDSFDLDSRSR